MTNKPSCLPCSMLHFGIAGLILVLLTYFFVDRCLMISLEPYAYHFMASSGVISFLTDPINNIFIWSTLYYLVRFIFKHKRMAEKVLLFVLSIACSYVFIFFLKVIFGRERPEILLLGGTYGFKFFSFQELHHSFPSGHATAIGAMMGSFSCFYPRYRILFLVLGLLLAFARVLLAQHYLSDILAGLLIGYLFAQAIWISMQTERK